MLLDFVHALPATARPEHSNSLLTGNVRVVPVSRVDAWQLPSHRFLVDPRVLSSSAFTSRVAVASWIELMNSSFPARVGVRAEQVYLLERDAGLLCRILGLYAARSLDVLSVDYSYAAQSVMKLSVAVAADQADACVCEESVRVLVAKASTLVGVIAAAEQPAPKTRRQLAVHDV